jgi:hypothetical protein
VTLLVLTLAVIYSAVTIALVLGWWWRHERRARTKTAPSHTVVQSEDAISDDACPHGCCQ